jgi:hypothetical protein
MRAMDTGKLREKHSERDLEKRWCPVNQQPLEKQQFESRNPQSSSEVDPRIKSSSFISTGEGWSSVDCRVEYADSEAPSEESRIHRQQVSESRDPQKDDRRDGFHVTTNSSKCMDVEQIFQEMEQRMKHRFHRLDETWNQIPLIMEQLKQHVDETKNIDSALFQMKAHFIPANDDGIGPVSFNIDESFGLTPSTSKDLDNSIEASFPRLRAYVSHLESTSTSAIAEALVDESGDPLFSSPSDETSNLSPSYTESWDQEIDESNTGLALIVELAVDDEVVPLANSPLRLQEKDSSSYSRTESLGEDIGSQTNWAHSRDVTGSMLTRHPFISKVTTKPSGGQPAYSCRITWVESPTSSAPRREGDSRAKVSLLQGKDRLHSEDNITWVEVPTSKSREEIGSEAKLVTVKSEDKGEDIQKRNPGDKNADWERFVLSLAPSDESAGSTQSCTESMSTVLLRAEIYCQEANLCLVHNEDNGFRTQIEEEGIPDQIKPQPLGPTVKQFHQIPHHTSVSKSSFEESECCSHLAAVVDGLNASLVHACTSCDRCLSVALNGSLPERS